MMNGIGNTEYKSLFLLNMKSNKNIHSGIVKHSLILVVMFAIVQYVFAVSGIRLNAGDKDRNKETHHSSGVFSDLKSTITFSIKDNYTFSNKNWKTDYKSPAGQAKLPNSIISYKKGNMVYILPYKPQGGVKLPDFIRMKPCESLSR